jgi:hypothetical protein
MMIAREQFRLKKLSDKKLLQSLDALVEKEKATTLGILLHLVELDRRRAYLALGYRSHDDFMTRMNQIRTRGITPNCEPVIIGSDAACTYTKTRQGFSVEMVYVSKRLYGLVGFAKPSILHRAINFISELKARIIYNKHMKTKNCN